MKLFDTVTLKTDRPDCGLKRGALGVIVAVFEQPREAFEVEFTNDRGETVAQLAFRRDELEVVTTPKG